MVFCKGGSDGRSQIFTDDVAIVFAATKSGAIRKFQNLYLRVEESEVQPVSLRKILKRPEILTDY